MTDTTETEQTETVNVEFYRRANITPVALAAERLRLRELRTALVLEHGRYEALLAAYDVIKAQRDSLLEALAGEERERAEARHAITPGEKPEVKGG